MGTALRHLSIGVNDPKRAVEAVAALTRGNVQSFHPVKGAYVCLWPDWDGQFVEFYPETVQLVLTDEGADFQPGENTSKFSSTHLNLETDLTGEEVKNIAARFGYKHHFQLQQLELQLPAGRGSPPHSAWFSVSSQLHFLQGSQ